MRYMGGKFRIRKQLASFLQSKLKPGQTYIEPFCGACWVMQEIKADKRIASDGCVPLVMMFQELQKGWIPPKNVTVAEYHQAIKEPRSMALLAFVRIACSFGGIWGSGYARDGNRNRADEGSRGLLKQLPLIQDVEFRTVDHYRDLMLVGDNCLIYCDPPYKGSEKYRYFKELFDTDEFWDVVRESSKYNDVYVSEYQAPDDFECVLEIKAKLDLRTKGDPTRIERLFNWKGVVK